MSDLRPSTPARRPESARPREDAEPAIDPPTPDELAAIERHLACLPVHSGATVTDDPAMGVLLVRQDGAGPAGNYAAMARWPAPAWRPSLARVVQLYRRLGTWPSLVVADRLDRPIGLGDALRRIGWHAVQRETVLWVGRASVVAHLDPATRIEAVQPRSVETHESLEREVFGLPPSMAAARRTSLATALGSGSLRAYVVRVGDEPVAVARLSQGDGVAGIYAVGVREGWRGRGYGTLVTTVATRAGMALGNRTVWLSVEDGNDRARRVYERLGFAEAFAWARWFASPDDPDPEPDEPAVGA
jgi:ribosomal protein S18 acetylase RimI-like enzyme